MHIYIHIQLSLMVQRQAKVGFTSLAHTSVDIQVFAAGSMRGLFSGMRQLDESCDTYE